MKKESLNLGKIYIEGNMKISVIGGAGFIGTNLCNESRSSGYKVIACDLYNTNRDDYIRCDVRNQS